MNEYQLLTSNELDEDPNLCCSDGFDELKKSFRKNCKSIEDFENMLKT